MSSSFLLLLLPVSFKSDFYSKLLLLPTVIPFLFFSCPPLPHHLPAIVYLSSFFEFNVGSIIICYSIYVVLKSQCTRKRDTPGTTSRSWKISDLSQILTVASSRQYELPVKFSACLEAVVAGFGDTQDLCEKQCV